MSSQMKGCLVMIYIQKHFWEWINQKYSMFQLEIVFDTQINELVTYRVIFLQVIIIIQRIPS